MWKTVAVTAGAMLACMAPAQAQTTNLANKALFDTAQYAGSSCSISPTQFSSWFASGSVTQNGLVTFADSVNFAPQSVCDFYKWAHQMFLWISSPIGGSILLDSPIFYDVNFNDQGNAVYIPNTVGAQNNKFLLRGTKAEKFQPGGQAGGGDTLLSQNGSLVYFAVHANDVYAWFNTAMTNQASGFNTNTPFPTTQAELNNILTYATSNGATIPDGPALTMELKTAWIDAATLADASSYITISASVPNYITTSSQTWTISTSQPTVVKTLALVGMHVVGPVAGHPELVWATFEHNANAPNNSYFIQLPSGEAVQIPYSSAGTWNFMSNGGSQAGALVAQMKVAADGTINATPGNSIQANNVYRVEPWGGPPTPASADNNSQLISLNADILQMLESVNDVRAHYVQIGSVWTSNGSIPTSSSDTGALAGSLTLANATMETYHQQDTNVGCFECHNSPSGSSTGTSHLFSLTNVPLPTK